MLIEKGFIKDFDCEVFVYNIDGIKVIFVDKDSDEFAFNATIYNRHKDNKGLPHMVEHCIFGGSLRYDINEPFEYLVQNKRYTYLNAITFRDRIVCPFSTYKRKDFDEILDVYLDSIFNPFLRDKTFKQECIRLEKGGYNGIVLNEMQEMYTDLDYKREDKLLSHFECNYLKYNSHGNPEDIIDVTYNDLIEYYHKNFTRDNIQLCFYGKMDHNEYLAKVKNISQNCFNYFGEDFEDQSEKLEIKLIEDTSVVDIVLAYEVVSKNELENLGLFFEYLLLSQNKLQNNDLLEISGIESIALNKNFDLQKKLIFITVKVGDKTKFEIENIQKYFNSILDEFDIELIQKIFLERTYNELNRDYGYKTNGIYTLLEISNIKDEILTYYNSHNSLKEIFNIVEEENIGISELFSKFKKILMMFQDKKYDIWNVSQKKMEIYKKNLDNYFIYSTEYVIINAVIVFNYDNIGIEGSYVLNNLNINEKFFQNIDFIKGVYSSRMQSETHDINGFYLHISVLKRKCLNLEKILYDLFEDIKFNELFLVDTLKYSYDMSCTELIELILKSHKRNSDNFYAKTEIDFNFVKDIYLISEEMNIEYLKQDRISLTQEIEANKEVKCFIQDFNNTILDFDNKIFKNILILKLKGECDFLYLELVLEALLNERIYPKVRLQNGAYEVSYKILKLENMIAFYSSADKHSKETIDIFKKEISEINSINISDFEKYLNKITNNFYRNEQNKSIKIQKLFFNYLLNISDTISNFDEHKLIKVLEVISDNVIEYELSFGKDCYKDYIDGGIYVY